MTPEPQPEPVEIHPGEPFKLPFGREASLKEAWLTLRCESVLEESRCPRQVDCIIAGQEVATLELTTSPIQQQDSAAYEGYQVQLVGLDSYPEVVD